MFTRQASRITSALSDSLPAASAQSMVQALCNCAQTLEHRGPAQFTFQQPWQGIYPSLQPPPGLAEPYRPSADLFPPITPGNVTIQLPPWNPITWENIPFIDVPVGSNGSSEFGFTPQSVPGSPWGGGPNMEWNPVFTPFLPQPPVQIPGELGVGPITSTGPVTSPEVNTGVINNYGDTFIDGDTFVEGDTYVEGDTTIEGDTYIGGDTITDQTVVHNGPVNHNNVVNNFNAVNNFAQMFFGGPVFFRRGPIRFVDARIFVNNLRVRLIDPMTVYTRVWYDAATHKIKATRQRVQFLGLTEPLPDRDVLTFTAAGASFDEATCSLVEVASGEQISYLKEVAAGDS